MLFKAELAKRVMAGTKTETRRVGFPHLLAVKLHKIDDLLPPTGKEWMEWTTLLSPAALRNALNRANFLLQFNAVELPIQPGRGKPMLGRRRVFGIDYRPLQDIEDAGIIREGIHAAFSEFERRQTFINLWDEIHQHDRANRWAQNPNVFIIQFEGEAQVLEPVTVRKHIHVAPALHAGFPAVYVHLTERDEFPLSLDPQTKDAIERSTMAQAARCAMDGHLMIDDEVLGRICKACGYQEGEGDATDQD